MKKPTPTLRYIFGCTAIMILTTLEYSTAQVITANDGFEGYSQHNVPPPDWYNCDDNSSVDTQPGVLDTNKPASEGYTYISLVTRELGPPGTIETVWAELKTPFMKDSCYKLSLDLSLSTEFNGSINWETYYFDNPCILQVIGFNGDCDNMDESEILYESEVLSNYDWETFNFTLSPAFANYNKIALRPNFTPPDNHKNSVLFIDNLRIQGSADSLTYTSGKYYLPDWASGIQWYFNGEIIEGETSHELPFFENGDYVVLFYDESGCLNSLSKTIKFDYSHVMLYPNPTSDNTTLRFYSPTEGFITFKVFNDVGQLTFIQDHVLEKGINNALFNFESLAPGTYFIKSNSAFNFLESFKIVIQR
jgi:hypothetical protein